MHKLIRLESKRNKLKPYDMAPVIISIIMTGFLYLIATIAKVEKVELFSDYGNILKMHIVITFIGFSVFSVVLFSKLLAAILGNVLMGLGASIYAFVGVIIFFAMGLGFARHHQAGFERKRTVYQR